MTQIDSDYLYSKTDSRILLFLSDWRFQVLFYTSLLSLFARDGKKKSEKAKTNFGKRDSARTIYTCCTDLKNSFLWPCHKLETVPFKLATCTRSHFEFANRFFHSSNKTLFHVCQPTRCNLIAVRQSVHSVPLTNSWPTTAVRRTHIFPARKTRKESRRIEDSFGIIGRQRPEANWLMVCSLTSSADERGSGKGYLVVHGSGIMIILGGRQIIVYVTTIPGLANRVHGCFDRKCVHMRVYPLLLVPPFPPHSFLVFSIEQTTEESHAFASMIRRLCFPAEKILVISRSVFLHWITVCTNEC